MNHLCCYDGVPEMELSKFLKTSGIPKERIYDVNMYDDPGLLNRMIEPPSIIVLRELTNDNVDSVVKSLSRIFQHRIPLVICTKCNSFIIKAFLRNVYLRAELSDLPTFEDDVKFYLRNDFATRSESYEF